MAAMRIKWLAVAAILAPAAAVHYYVPQTEADRACEASKNAMCAPVEGLDAFSYSCRWSTPCQEGDTCNVICWDACNGEGSVPMTTSCVPYAEYWIWILLLIFTCTLCRLVWKVLNCIFCGVCEKSTSMH